MRRFVTLVAALAAALPILAAPVARATGPDPHHKPLADGCIRSQAAELALSDREWVYVNRADVRAARLAGNASAGRQTAEGIVGDIHPAGDDLYWDHEFGDVDIDLDVDPAYQDLVAQGHDGLGMEWEDALLPMWAWPQVGDRVRASGSWIWDCGHWGDGPADPTGLSPFLPYDPVETVQDLASPGAIAGESTELHPLYELATFRKDAAGMLGGTPRRLERLDAWISGDGGWALAEEECTLYGLTVAATRTCSRYRDVGGTYTYTMKLATKPSSASQIVINPVVVHSESDSVLAVSTVADETAGTVTVSFSIPHTGVPQHFGVSVEAGWNDDPMPVVHHRVTLDSIHFEKSLDAASEPSRNPVNNAPEVLNFDPGEWVMVAQASGHWEEILPLPGRSGLVTDNMTVAPGTVFDFYLPAGVTPRLFVSARECDIPLIDCTNDYFGGHEQTPSAEVGYNDHPGRIQDPTKGWSSDVGRLMIDGTHDYAPRANASVNGNEWDSDSTCGSASCYQVTATWTSS